MALWFSASRRLFCCLFVGFRSLSLLFAGSKGKEKILVLDWCLGDWSGLGLESVSVGISPRFESVFVSVSRMCRGVFLRVKNRASLGFVRGFFMEDERRLAWGVRCAVTRAWAVLCLVKKRGWQSGGEVGGQVYDWEKDGGGSEAAEGRRLGFSVSGN